MERLMLLDGNGLIYRGYFALINTPLTTSKGELVNAVFGFCNIVLRGFQDIQPDYAVIAFDLSGPTFRHEQYAAYKATRQRMPDDLRDQFPKVREVVKALRIPVLELAGFEADDVIGTLTLEAEQRGLDTTIVTGDLDMLQLVTDRTRLMTTRMGVQNTVIYDPQKILERYGLRPDQMIDFKALKGDSSDNIPGVPGVGEKTAAKLISDHGSLDGLYEHLDEVTPARLREPLGAAKDQVLLGRELMRIVRDLPVTLDLDAARLGDYDRDTVIRLFREFEFRTLIERLPPLRGERAEDTAAAIRGSVAGEGPMRAAQVPGSASRGSAGWGSGERPVRGRDGLIGGGSGLQLALDFSSVDGGSSGPAERPPVSERDAPAEGGDPLGPPHEGPLVLDLRTVLAAAIEDPLAHVEVVTGQGIERIESWLAGQSAVGIALLADDPRPRKGTPLALAVAGLDGRVVAAEGPADSARLRGLVERLEIPIVGHEVKPLLVARFA
ncbi:MAG: 5'-3' exonuclease, partial [Candidatus Limnocylindrales bacterium]